MAKRIPKINFFKAAWAVDRARCELQRLGFQVEVPNCPTKPGPDLEILHKPGEIYVLPRPSIEVKLASLSKCKRGKAWRVNRVGALRRKDDLIAIVFPNGHVHLDAMKDHLKLCNKSGDRYLHGLGRFFA